MYMYVMYVHARASTLSLQLGKFPSGFRCLLLGHAFSLRAVNPDIKWPRDLLTPLPSVYFPICDEANIVKVPSGSDRTTVPDSNWEMGLRANNVGSRENNVASPSPLALALCAPRVSG